MHTVSSVLNALRVGPKRNNKSAEPPTGFFSSYAYVVGGFSH